MRRYHSFPWVFLVETCRNPWALCGSKFQTQKTCWNINFWAAKVWLIAIAFFCQTETQSRMLSTRSIPRSSRFATLAILGCYSMQNATFGLAKWVIPKISLLIIIWLVVWNIFFIFPYIGNNHPDWLIFFRRVETTNQIYISIHVMDIISNP